MKYAWIVVRCAFRVVIVVLFFLSLLWHFDSRRTGRWTILDGHVVSGQRERGKGSREVSRRRPGQSGHDSENRCGGIGAALVVLALALDFFWVGLLLRLLVTMLLAWSGRNLLFCSAGLVGKSHFKRSTHLIRNRSHNMPQIPKSLNLPLFCPRASRVRVRSGDTYGLPENFIGVGVVISPRPPSDFSELTADPLKPSGPRQ